MKSDPHEMISAYSQGKLNEAQVADLEAWLREDPANKRLFVR